VPHDNDSETADVLACRTCAGAIYFALSIINSARRATISREHNAVHPAKPPEGKSVSKHSAMDELKVLRENEPF
jgi:hypothetical protein